MNDVTAVEYLDQQVRAVCPSVQGLRIPNWRDKESWGVTPDAVPANELAQARSIFDNFNKAAWEAAQPVVKTLEERVAALESKAV